MVKACLVPGIFTGLSAAVYRDILNSKHAEVGSGILTFTTGLSGLTVHGITGNT